MDLFKNFSNNSDNSDNSKNQDPNKTEKRFTMKSNITNARRYAIVEEMINNLKRIDFTDKEISEVVSIIEKCQKEVNAIKTDILDHDAVNNASHETMDEKIFKIQKLEKAAALEVNAKISEIMERKKPS